MLQISYFGTTQKGHYFIAIFNTNTHQVTHYLVRQDFTPFPLSNHTFPVRNEWRTAPLNRLSGTKKSRRRSMEEVSFVSQIDLLLSAKKKGADYPAGFRKNLRRMKNDMEVLGKFRLFNAGLGKEMILAVAQRYPNEMREFLNECLSGNTTKLFSSELKDVMKENKVLFGALSKLAMECPEKFQNFLHECTESIADYAPTVPGLK